MSDNLLCPHCRGTIQRNPQLAGQSVACPLCNRQFVMPPSATPLGQASRPPAPPLHKEPPQAPSRTTPTPPSPPPTGQGFPQIATEPANPSSGSVAARGGRRRKQGLNPKTLFIVGGIAGGSVLLLVVAVVALVVMNAFSSDPGGGLTSMIPDAVNLPLAVDPQIAADRETVKRELLTQYQAKQPKVIEWGEPETTSYAVIFTLQPPNQGTTIVFVRSPESVPTKQRQLEQQGGLSYEVAKVEPRQISYPFVFEVTEGGRRVLYDATYTVKWNFEAGHTNGVFEVEKFDRQVSLGSRVPRDRDSGDNEQVANNGNANREGPFARPNLGPVAPVADLKATVTELVHCLDPDSHAKAKYNGKTVEISAKVANFSTGPNTFNRELGPYVLLIEPDETEYGLDPDVPEVRLCGPANKPWQIFSVDDKVTVRAVVHVSDRWGLQLGPYEVVETDGGPSPYITAAQIAQRVDEDFEAAKKELHLKRFFIEGVIARVPEHEYVGKFPLTAVLQGNGSIEVPLFSPNVKAAYKPFQPGDRVRLYGGVVFVVDPAEGGHQFTIGNSRCMMPSDREERAAQW